jgi:hypothetical protein
MLATLRVDGAVDTEIFAVFVSQVLVPALQPGEVVLLANLPVPQASTIE